MTRPPIVHMDMPRAGLRASFAWAALCLVLLSCGGSGGQAQAEDVRIFVSVVHHNEELPDFVGDEAAFRNYRGRLLELAEYLSGIGVVLNFQPDWRFLEAVGAYETEGSAYLEASGGKNIVRYIKEDLGHEVDPHSHETTYNYADVACLIKGLGVEPSGIAGGFIAIPVEASVYEQFLSPMTGRVLPDCAWQADTLWGASSEGHAGDVSASGVWRPRDSDDFFVHDDEAPLPHIGSYSKTIEGVEGLAGMAESGELEAGRIYTATVYVGWESMGEELEGLKEGIAELKGREAGGIIEFASLGTVLSIWKADFNSEGSIYIAAPEDSD